MPPLSAMAHSFHLRVSMPAASAAASFCLMAISAMPKRERSTRRVITTITVSMTRATIVYHCGFSNCM